MAAIVGDRVTVQPKSVHASERTGTVEAVLSESAPRYQVRWDDGRWSIIAPTDGALRVVSESARAKPPARRRAATG
jgi:Domain of unknown function (DUF1918)